ncbi:hypothetical protein [Plantactinospora soyae]|uniref:Uncharacterized protein n=1 Tax=Plantactinospora soyae TaxID=1544732 RepID=A0A927M454_9ACTN|nr:hypothetical protein [Plantactinospora soyae]MBE1486321.1 hypothetical protein [Plantactinospora soyae]
MGTLTMTAERGAGSRDSPADLLRRSLRIDGWGTAAFGVVMLLGGRRLGGTLGLPSGWFVPVGIAMLGGAAALGLIARQPRISSRLAWSAIAGNALSGAVILPLAVTDVVPLTGLGIAFMVAGALWVMTFAGLALVGLRRSRRLP